MENSHRTGNSRANGVDFRCTALESLKGQNRIEWFGQIYRGAASSVAVVFSPWGINPETGEVRPCSAKRTTILVPVPFLRRFRMGDIWEDGRFTGQRDLQARETFTLAVDKDAVKVIPVGAPLNDDPLNPEYPLPFSLFEAHKEDTGANCARVDLDERSTLLVPCMELIRFYFGASGSFLKRLFSGAFALDQLYSAARLNRNSQTANLDLAEDLAGAAAVTVARIAFDQQARSAASWIVNSAVVASANKTRYYPKTTFPFLGETDLTAEGRWIESDGHRVFLAERLVRCTHPFPFSTLFYTTRKSVVSPRRIYGSFAGEQCDADDCASIPHPPMLQLDEGTVSSILQPVAIPGDELDDEPFPDLAQKKIRRVKSIVPNGPATPRHETPQLSTGDETTASDVRAAEIMVDVEDDSSDNALIEELPTEAVDMFSEAFDTYKAASKGRYRLKLPAFDTESVKSRPGPFLRGDAISGTSDTRLARVWCAMIESLEEKCGPVLVMVRDGVTRDHEDHLVLVRIDGDVDSTEEIARCLDEFAKGHLVGPLKQNTLISCRTESATNLYSLLRSLSVGLQRLHSGGTEAEDCLVWPNLTSLQEPLISSDQVAVILHAARQSR